MATKLNQTLAVALLLALVSLTRSTNPEEDPAQCRQELQGKQFRACQRFLSPQSLLKMMRVEGKQPPVALLECCRQLHGVTQKCRCEAVKQAARLQQERQREGSWSPEQMKEVQEKFSRIPTQCGMRQQKCQIRTVFV